LSIELRQQQVLTHDLPPPSPSIVADILSRGKGAHRGVAASTAHRGKAIRASPAPPSNKQNAMNRDSRRRWLRQRRRRVQLVAGSVGPGDELARAG